MNAKLFINYRRKDTAPHAGRLHDRLAAHFGKDRSSSISTKSIRATTSSKRSTTKSAVGVSVSDLTWVRKKLCAMGGQNHVAVRAAADIAGCRL